MRALALTLSGLNSALSKINFQPELERKANHISNGISLEAEFDDVTINTEIVAVDTAEVRLNIEQVELKFDGLEDEKQSKKYLKSVILGINN